MHDTSDAFADIYGNYRADGLLDRLDTLLASFPEGQLSVQQLAPLDQFHTGGLPASVEIGRLLNLPPGASLLDLGSGLGGPARYFAAALGVRVHGIDLSSTFVTASRYLTERTGISGVTFSEGNVTALDAADASFDGAVMLHVAMNVADRVALYREIARVLEPGAPFVSYDVVRVTDDPEYPVPWAVEKSGSFLLTADDTKRALEDAGFSIAAWKVGREEAIASFAQFDPATPPPLGILLGARDIGTRILNLRNGLAEGRIAILAARAVRASSD